MVTNFAEMSLQ